MSTTPGRTDFPPIVTLCGSTRFRDEFLAETRRLTLDGVIVVGVGVYGHHEPDFDPAGATKAMLDALHLRKIDLADRIHVVNPGGYIGQSTRREIAYATDHGKPVTYLVGPDECDECQQPITGDVFVRAPSGATLHPECAVD